jgi:hypothetical protein
MPEDYEEDFAGEDTVTPRDLADVIRGRATPDQTRRVADALDDPFSQVNAWLEGLSEVAKDLPGPTRSAPAHWAVQTSTALHKLTALHEFVRKRHAAGIISDDEIAELQLESNTPDAPLTAAEAFRAVADLTSAILHLHPELAAELRRELASKGR